MGHPYDIFRQCLPSARLHASGASSELWEGPHLPQRAHPAGSYRRGVRKPPRESVDSSAEAPRLSKLGGLESHNDATGRAAVLGSCRQACSEPGPTATGAAGLPTWDGVVEACGLLPVQGSVVVLLPLGVDPYPEAVFLF